MTYRLTFILLIVCMSQPVFAQSSWTSCRNSVVEVDQSINGILFQTNRAINNLNTFKKNLIESSNTSLDFTIKTALNEEQSNVVRLQNLYILKFNTRSLTCLMADNLYSYLKNYDDTKKIDWDHILHFNKHYIKTNNRRVKVDPFYNFKIIGLDKVKSNFTGEGVTIGVIDSGVDYNHPSLWNRIKLNEDIVSDANLDGEIDLNDVDLNSNMFLELPTESDPYTELVMTPYTHRNMFGHFYNSKPSLRTPLDLHGHGTHVAGIIAGSSNYLEGFRGIAPDTKIIAQKIFNDNAVWLDTGKDFQTPILSFTASELTLLSAISNAVSNGAKVINMSFEGIKPNSFVFGVISNLTKLGIIFVAAAGNYSTNTDEEPVYPGSYSSVISVASVNAQRKISSFSNYGNGVDIAAPGEDIISTMGSTSNTVLLQNLSSVGKTLNNLSGHYRLSGTSQASPHVAGAIALVKSKYPNFNLSDIRAILKESSSPIEYLN